MVSSETRNIWAWKISNWVLTHIATPDYGTYLVTAVKYGILRIAQDEGHAEAFREFWIPDTETKYKMFAEFLTEGESAVLTSDNGDIVFLSPDEIKVTKATDYDYS